MSNEQLQLRSFEVSLSEVENISDELIVRGVVNKPGEWSHPLPDANGKPFIERIMPKVFTNALNRGNNVKLLANHDDNVLLASMKNGTLKLFETESGLEMEARLAPSDLGKHIHTLVKTGEMTHMSFGMKVLKDKWANVAGVVQRSIEELYLKEVSIVSDPAYPQSAISTRSIDIVEAVVPNTMERNYKEMNEKQLEERKQDLLSELDEATEVREKEIELEINDINNELNKLKNKQLKGNQPTMTNLEKEIRGANDLIRGNETEERAMYSNIGHGSYTVPTEIEQNIVKQVLNVAPLFARTKKHTPVNGNLDILVETGIENATWVGEGQPVSMKDFTVDKVTLDQKRVGSAIELTKHLLNDSGVNLYEYTSDILTRRIGTAIDRAVINGDPTKDSFQGILNAGLANDVVAESATAIKMDELLKLKVKLHKNFKQGAVWVVSQSTFEYIATQTDGNGHYFLVDDVVNGEPSYKLFGHEILVSDVMNEMVAGKQAVIFGNFGAGYSTMIKQGVEFSLISDKNDSLNGVVTFMIDAYMDGKVSNKEAFKVLAMKSA